MNSGRHVTSDSTITVEILGPPGAGKSALVSSLCRQSDEVLLVHTYLSLRNLIPWLRGAVALLPVLLSRAPKGGRSLKKLAWMIRLEASSLILRRRFPGASALVFDQGPIYTMARMRERTPQQGRAPRLQEWLQENVSAWAVALDVLIFLDAPDEVLLKRILERPKEHLLKGYSENRAREILVKHRARYESLIDELRSQEDLRVIRLDTSRSSLDEIVVNVMTALALSADETGNGSRSDSPTRPFGPGTRERTARKTD